MAAKRILIANRSEIAVRLQGAILRLGHTPLGIYTESEGPFVPHLIHLADEQKLRIPGDGARAYLDAQAIVRAAKEARADAVIPGYGFLSESPDFAQAVLDAGLTWIGPEPDTLCLFGDKHSAKEFAKRAGVPVLPSTSSDASIEEITEFARSLPAGANVLLKALAGGGGRGIRAVENVDDLQEAYDGCRREAKAAFGEDRLFAEPFLKQARHIEVQVLGDGTGRVLEIGERECSLQRRHQKLIEICPSPTLRAKSHLRQRILSSAVQLASAGKLKTLATIEFLVTSDQQYYFLECNPRLQVEHTCTEEVYGIDLVAAQIRVAFGSRLDELDVQVSPARKTAIQLRLNAERFHSDGTSTGTTGRLDNFAFPTGPGIRIDTAAHGAQPHPVGHFHQSLDFDSLLAKFIFTAPSYEAAVEKAHRGLQQVQCGGLATNKSLLLALLADERVKRNEAVHTRFVEENARQLYDTVVHLEEQWRSEAASAAPAESRESSKSGPNDTLPTLPQGQVYLRIHLPGRLTSLIPTEGSQVRKGDTIAVIESMKMEHTVRAEQQGKVEKVIATVGEGLDEGSALIVLRVDGESSGEDEAAASDEAARAEDDSRSRLLEEWQAARNQSKDDHSYRRSGTDKRHAKGHRTARENLHDLINEGSLIEYGDLVLAAQRTRLEGEALDKTRNDGVIVGWATVNASQCSSAQNARCAVIIYDYGVLAGTQGHFHHAKLDRILHSVLANPAPVIIFAEGGGGRPGDVDLLNLKIGGLDVPTFGLLARVKARGIPIITIANGNVFAGNAALLGCGDVIIATNHPDTSIGMGGPAMIAGGGLGIVKPREVGPVSVHDFNGNVDIVVADEKEATRVAKQVLSVFQGARQQAGSQNSFDPQGFRNIIPPSRKRAYDIHPILEALADDDFGFVEIGAAWGKALVTGFIRVDGVPLAVIASSVLNELGGAIDARSADKASRFLDVLTRTRACHLLALCDVPGFMVGTAAEKQGSLRSFATYFTASQSFQDSGGNIFGLVLRKAYGLGAQALLGGSTLAPFHSASWPTGEFGAMGIEGAVKLGMRKELEAIEDEGERKEMEAAMVGEMYERGKALRMAEMGEIDTVIDPAETLNWLRKCLSSVDPRVGTVEQKRGEGHRSRL